MLSTKSQSIIARPSWLSSGGEVQVFVWDICWKVLSSARINSASVSPKCILHTFAWHWTVKELWRGAGYKARIQLNSHSSPNWRNAAAKSPPFYSRRYKEDLQIRWKCANFCNLVDWCLRTAGRLHGGRRFPVHSRRIESEGHCFGRGGGDSAALRGPVVEHNAPLECAALRQVESQCDEHTAAVPGARRCQHQARLRRVRARW